MMQQIATSSVCASYFGLARLLALKQLSTSDVLHIYQTCWEETRSRGAGPLSRSHETQQSTALECPGGGGGIVHLYSKTQEQCWPLVDASTLCASVRRGLPNSPSLLHYTGGHI